MSAAGSSPSSDSASIFKTKHIDDDSEAQTLATKPGLYSLPIYGSLLEHYTVQDIFADEIAKIDQQYLSAGFPPDDKPSLDRFRLLRAQQCFDMMTWGTTFNKYSILSIVQPLSFSQVRCLAAMCRARDEGNLPTQDDLITKGVLERTINRLKRDYIGTKTRFFLKLGMCFSVSLRLVLKQRMLTFAHLFSSQQVDAHHGTQRQSTQTLISCAILNAGSMPRSK